MSSHNYNLRTRQINEPVTSKHQKRNSSAGMEIFASISGVISQHVFERIPPHRHAELQQLAAERGVTLIREGADHVVEGSQSGVSDVTAFINQLIQDQTDDPSETVIPIVKQEQLCESESEDYAEAKPQLCKLERYEAMTQLCKSVSADENGAAEEPSVPKRVPSPPARKRKQPNNEENKQSSRTPPGDTRVVMAPRTRGKKLDVFSLLSGKTPKREGTTQHASTPKRVIRVKVIPAGSRHMRTLESDRNLNSDLKTESCDDSMDSSHSRATESDLKSIDTADTLDNSPCIVFNQTVFELTVKQEQASDDIDTAQATYSVSDHTGMDNLASPHTQIHFAETDSGRYTPHQDATNNAMDSFTDYMGVDVTYFDGGVTGEASDVMDHDVTGLAGVRNTCHVEIVSEQALETEEAECEDAHAQSESREQRVAESRAERGARLHRMIQVGRRNQSNKRARLAHVTVTHPQITFREYPTNSVLYVTATQQYQCTGCGYLSQSDSALKAHLYNYHKSASPVCDICFRALQNTSLYAKHRRAHFDSHDQLLPSAIVIHKMKLAELGVEENLTGELLEQVQRHTDQSAQHPTATTAHRSVTEREKKLQSVQCSVCFATLSQAKFLRTHMRTVHGETRRRKKAEHCAKQLSRLRGEAVPGLEQQYTCPQCDFVTTRIQNFKSHFRVHEQPDCFRCDVPGCNYTNKSNAEVRRHKRNAHAEKKYACAECPLKFRTEPQLSAHVKIKHTREYERVCEVCGKTLSSLSTYRKHKEAHHSHPAIQPGERIMCQKCGRVFRTMAAFRSHEHKFHADAADSALKEERLVSEGLNVLHNGQLFSCRHCDAFSSTSARAVRQHIVRVHLARVHQCQQCDATFTRHAFLVKHVAMHHLGLDVTPCPDCGKTFKSKSYVAHHRRRMHQRQGAEHQCHVCHKAFARQADLLKHSELHIPEEDRKWAFQCGMCERRFRFKSNLDYHMLEHTGVKAFSCAVCERSFKTQSMLGAHMRTHTEARDYHCSLCEKTFKQAKYLDVHLLQHSGDSFVCDACCRLFPHQAALDRHICKAVSYAGEDVGAAIDTVVVTDVAADTDMVNVTDCASPELIISEAGADRFVIAHEVLADEEEVQQFVAPSSGDIVLQQQCIDASVIPQQMETYTARIEEGSQGSVSVEPGEISGAVLEDMYVTTAGADYLVVKEKHAVPHTMTDTHMSQQADIIHS